MTSLAQGAWHGSACLGPSGGLWRRQSVLDGL